MATPTPDRLANGHESPQRIAMRPSTSEKPTTQKDCRHEDSSGTEDEKATVANGDCQCPDDDETDLREPSRFVKCIANRPRLAFGISVGVHVFFLALSGILVVSGYDLFPANFDMLPLELYDEPWLKREYAWTDRDEYPNAVNRTLPSNKYPTWERAFTKMSLLLFYNAGSDNVFTKTNLQLMQSIEQDLVTVTQFSAHCQLQADGTCHKPLSVLRFFDGTYVTVNPVFNDPNFDNIDAVLYEAYTNNLTKSAFLFSLGNNHEITSSSVFCTLTRTSIPLGWPLPGYSTEKEMEQNLTDFMADYMLSKLDQYLEVSEFEFTFYNNNLMFNEVQKQALFDMALTGGSMVFIFLFMWFHTRSLWVTFFAQMSIISSFIETNFIYRVIIGFKYFGFFHVLTMFIILGIGADDLFVFWDAWTAAGLRKFPSLAHRLNNSYKKSVISMLVTSLTTTIAFMANALSPLLATRSFGVFAGILICINYISVTTFFPSIVVFYHLNFEKKPHPCCCCWKRKSKSEEEENIPSRYTSDIPNQHAVRISTIAYGNRNQTTTYHNGVTRNAVSPTHSPKTDYLSSFRTETPKLDFNSTNNLISEDTEVTEKPSKLVIFFRDYYFKFVTHKVIRWLILALLLGCLVFFAVSASKLEPDNEQIQLYTDSHHYSRAIKFNNYGFVANDYDRTVTIYLVWGLNQNDLSSCHFSAMECRGEQSFDSTFDASTQAAQEAFLRLCDTLVGFTADQISSFAVKEDLVTGQPEIACFPHSMETFLRNDPAVSNSLNVSMPWDWSKTSSFMTSLNAHYNTSAFTPSFSRFLDIPLTYWIWDGFQQNNTEDYQRFNSLFGEELDAQSNNVLSAPSLLTGNRVKYMAIAVNTTLKLHSVGYDKGIPIVERWEDFMQQQLKTMPAEMQSGFQTTVLAWHWLYVQRALVQNAILGIAVGASLAFPILVLATWNIFNGLLATLTICCVTVCVIGVIPLGGWKLGVLVSLNMCLVVGLAVDFVVHLAEGYHMAHARDRHGRLQQSLERMGISVFSGACTTLGASAFMLFAKIQFFFQFGIFMFCTIGFSLLFSMGLYVTVMGILGPEGDTGDIRVFFKKCFTCNRQPKQQN